MRGLASEHPREYPKGTAPLSREEVQTLSSEVPGWTPTDGKLSRGFDFKDFSEAFAFLTRVALLAEREGHHPDMFVSWNHVDLTFWTHTAEGLTRNDFILAAKVDRLNG
jgi:4a-hydroxytetrahydrobiopterin dehydratase